MRSDVSISCRRCTLVDQLFLIFVYHVLPFMDKVKQRFLFVLSERTERERLPTPLLLPRPAAADAYR